MIDPAALSELEDKVGLALDGAGDGALDILGYGEISIVLRLGGCCGPVAAKRLPLMTPDQFTSYEETLHLYVDALEQRGVTPVASTLHPVGSDPIVPYCVQPLQRTLLVEELQSANAATTAKRAAQLVGTVVAAVDGRMGLDGQISNWAVEGDELVYFDVTTPLMRDETGAEMLDVGMFIASLPWFLQGIVQRFLLAEILSHYYDPRAVLVDIAGNLHKERLAHTIPVFIEAANRVVKPEITEKEIRRYYRSDARMWGLLQRLRRADRWWQHTVRHRRYPFLLPGRIDR